MTTASLLREVQTSGISLFVVDGKLRIEAPKGRLTPALRDEISRHKTEIIKELKSTSPAPGGDPLNLFKREYRRLSLRLSRVIIPGYLAWTAQNHPELYREIEVARMAWDTTERLESLKAGRIAWKDYRVLMLQWARLHVRAIKFHRRERSGSSPGALRGGAV